MSIPSVTVSPDVAIPAIGFGLWQVADELTCKQAVRWALEAGYRHFDTAQIYGNEPFLGEALQDSGLARSEIFITTKIWNENQSWDNLPASFDGSLRALRTDYVDLLLLHWPRSDTRRRAWRRMEELQQNGTARTIGVSNYTISHLEELLSECDIKPSVNQVELHVFLQQPELLQYCRQNNITIEAYSPLAHGRGLDNSALLKIADKYGKSPAQIMIRWCIELGLIPLPKSVHQQRIRDNINVFDFVLDRDDLDDISKLEKNLRVCWDPTNIP